MRLHLGWAGFLAIGMLMGYLCGVSQEPHAAVPAFGVAQAQAAAADNGDDVLLRQFKEMNFHLKRIDDLLYSGRLRVIDVINPDVQ